MINLLGGFLTPVADQGKIQVNGQTLAFEPRRLAAELFLHSAKPISVPCNVSREYRFYQPDASRQAIERAAENAGLTAWIATLPAGLDTAIGEGSRGVSGGQAQRIALARGLS
ncbi:ATP-binding cassette domain-containing protein [Lactiplantibacillus plantarum]|uniref:ATP-binding cassette domain-containing protein n=1 Tax=Lactiplantibacillus plantarum TaxID=1590 RepID=UPI000B131648|nr:ATP-binding cassette domain-containing protein [Lactiplantibacillus plantarum]